MFRPRPRPRRAAAPAAQGRPLRCWREGAGGALDARAGRGRAEEAALGQPGPRRDGEADLGAVVVAEPPACVVHLPVLDELDHDVDGPALAAYAPAGAAVPGHGHGCSSGGTGGRRSDTASTLNPPLRPRAPRQNPMRISPPSP